MANILIASTSVDEYTYRPVVEKLESMHQDVFVYNADAVTSGLASFRLNILNSDSTNVNFSYNDEYIDLSKVSAAWYRHPELLGYDYQDKAKQLCIEDEASRLQDALWQQIPDVRWLNSPNNIRLAQTKLSQLVLARMIGFDIPETTVANNWVDIISDLPQQEIIVKMSRGLLYETDETKGMYATVIEPHKIVKASNDINPFPAIFQTYINKAREWRVTVVGDEVFEAAIYTSDAAKDDWRKHQFGTDVEFRDESIDDNIKQKCIKMLRKLGLRFGAFDFIEDSDGMMTFLEVNPNGQYMWLEDGLGLPISSAIATELNQIANRNQ